MGQAKQRGSRDERVTQAAAKIEALGPGSIITYLLEGIEVPEFDSEIANKFGMQVGTMKAIRAQRMQVGIRNAKGEIYRAIGVTGLGEFLSIVQHLADIGLVDELKDETGTRNGYDAIFSA